MSLVIFLSVAKKFGSALIALEGLRPQPVTKFGKSNDIGSSVWNLFSRRPSRREAKLL